MTEQTSGTAAVAVPEYDLVRGMKVVLSAQTYGPVNPITAKHLRVAVMHAANKGVVWAGDTSPDRMGYGCARNTAVMFAFDLAADSDGIMWVDSDIRPDADSITRLLSTVKRGPFDFVTGVYFQREGVHNPVFYGWNSDLYHFQPAEDYPPNSIGPVDGCGFGFVFTSLKMLRDITKTDEFSPKIGWFPDKRDAGGFGEDLSFCYLAKQAGYQLWVDTGIQVAHEGNVQYVTEEDFRREQKKWIEDNKKQKPVRWEIK